MGLFQQPVNEPIGELKVIRDFLPPPDQLVFAPHKILFGAGNDDIGPENDYFWDLKDE